MSTKYPHKPVNMGFVGICCFVLIYGNLFPAFTFFLNCFHVPFRNELVVCMETTGLMQCIC